MPTKKGTISQRLFAWLKQRHISMKNVCVCVHDSPEATRRIHILLENVMPSMVRAGSIAQRYYCAVLCSVLLSQCSIIAAHTTVWCTVCHAVMNCAKCLLYESTQNQLMLKVLRWFFIHIFRLLELLCTSIREQVIHTHTHVMCVCVRACTCIHVYLFNVLQLRVCAFFPLCFFCHLTVGDTAHCVQRCECMLLLGIRLYSFFLCISCHLHVGYKNNKNLTEVNET